ncbi:hypothetical protein [Xylocopilactobacillus apicola]|uniref:Amidase domain-containing protein n=1 Tax=Xylocopilactobacillus apicola TaxID=2932184 RepID=A0AAU9D3L7_9LACO|nr:hypothetical protein [Xylocopilactobacillus apicola]BDR58033.1 hypothetical protein XA3_04740 [Xylocopilactobacillus apicola]
MLFFLDFYFFKYILQFFKTVVKILSINSGEKKDESTYSEPVDVESNNAQNQLNESNVEEKRGTSENKTSESELTNKDKTQSSQRNVEIVSRSNNKNLNLSEQNPNLHPEVIRFAYDLEVKKDKIDPNKNTFETYSANYKKGFNSFLSLRTIMDPELSYTDWFEKFCNNGANPEGVGYSSSSNLLTRKKLSREQLANAQRFRNDLRKGDIVVVTTGAMGHAEIATTRNYLLEISGSGNVQDWFWGTLHNNNQYVIEDWIFLIGYALDGSRARNYISEKQKYID